MNRYIKVKVIRVKIVRSIEENRHQKTDSRAVCWGRHCGFSHGGDTGLPSPFWLCLCVCILTRSGTTYKYTVMKVRVISPCEHFTTISQCIYMYYVISMLYIFWDDNVNINRFPILSHNVGLRFFLKNNLYYSIWRWNTTKAKLWGNNTYLIYGSIFLV